MKFLPRWIASVLTIGVFLSLSFCGAMMSASTTTGMAHEMSSVSSIQCVGGSCSSSEMPCAVQCLQRLDRSQQRVIAEIVASVALIAFGISFFVHDYSNERVSVFPAPPWRAHRLFAFRE